jgi:tetratricopeptide (TPR) repeat protein
MVPGVVCEKEKARVAFENEVRKDVDPGLVEQVKGNLWRTRIFPLEPKQPRRAEVEFLRPLPLNETSPTHLLERDGEDYFLATRQDAVKQPDIASSIAHFDKGIILWDASLSAEPFAATWRTRLEALPEHGEWQLCFFRHQPSPLVTIKTKTELLAAIDQCVYDGGTHLSAALQVLPQQTLALLFSDEIDTMSLSSTPYEMRPGLIIASRKEAPQYAVHIEKITKDALPELPATKSTLLATMWASRRMQDLADQADHRQAEFLALGRRYGVAGPGLSLLVLETLEQWVVHDIEPPQQLALHAEWKRIKAASDDAIAQKRAQVEHEKNLLTYWEERITWWNDPKPQIKTPKSGLFDAFFGGEDEGMEVEEAMLRSAPAPQAVAAYSDGAFGEDDFDLAEEAEAKGERAAPVAKGPIIQLQAWNPQTPYLKALKAVPMDEAYKVYLQQRETYRTSPAFYLDCAHWFFKTHGDQALAEQILTNLADFKLEEVALWRTMGWRLREAGRYELAVHAFRKVLALRPEEGQSYRDLALVLMEDGKALKRAGYAKAAAPLLTEALEHFMSAAFKLHTRRSMRRDNDFQVAVIALEELNGLIAWIEAQTWHEEAAPTLPTLNPVYRRNLPMKLRIVMSWDTDNTDIDIHVLEPNGEEAYYSHRRTREGGFVSEDVTTGYGPEEYLKKELEKGTYKILSNYFASHQVDLIGATTITATVYTDWGTTNEKQQILTFRLDKAKDKDLIGEVTLE